jgi:hypothetical protein
MVSYGMCDADVICEEFFDSSGIVVGVLVPCISRGVGGILNLLSVIQGSATGIHFMALLDGIYFNADLAKLRERAITPGHYGRRHRPGNRETRIIPYDASLGLWNLLPGHLVIDLCSIGERLETVSKASGNEQCKSVVCAEFDGMPAPETN